MNNPDEIAARTTLRIAGVFQEIRNSWIRRLDSYYNQIESLVDGDWLDHQDISGIIRESRMAAKEAMDGLGNDLSAELVHASNGIITRYEAERSSLQEEINDLRTSLVRTLSGDANSIRRENEALRIAILSIPEFRLLDTIKKNRRSTYEELSSTTGLKKSQLRKQVKELLVRGYVQVDKKSKPHSIIFLSSPWNTIEPEEQHILEINETSLHLPARAPRL